MASGDDVTWAARANARTMLAGAATKKKELKQLEIGMRSG